MKIEIIPRPKDVAKEDHQLDERLDWIYDEASCSQINFIYSEIAKNTLVIIKIILIYMVKRKWT